MIQQRGDLSTMTLENFIKTIMKKVPGLRVVAVTDCEANTLLEVQSSNGETFSPLTGIVQKGLNSSPHMNKNKENDEVDHEFEGRRKSDKTKQPFHNDSSVGSQNTNNNNLYDGDRPASPQAPHGEREDTNVLEALSAAFCVACSQAEKVPRFGQLKSVMSYYRDRTLYQIRGKSDLTLSLYAEVDVNICLLKSAATPILECIESMDLSSYRDIS